MELRSSAFTEHPGHATEVLRRTKPDLYERLGARVIGFDRPGYGTLHPQTRSHGCADAARDVEAIADALGLEHFAVTGGSGGGPHCLAVATLLPERVNEGRLRSRSCSVGRSRTHGAPSGSMA